MPRVTGSSKRPPDPESTESGGRVFWEPFADALRQKIIGGEMKMKREHLFRMLDIVIAFALFRLAEELPFPYPRTLAGFWSNHRAILRSLTSMLWLAGLWFNLYRVRGADDRMDNRSLLSGMALMLCVLLTPYATQLILQFRARLVFQVYGGLMLFSAGMCYALCALLERAGTDGPQDTEASRRTRRTIAIAFVLLAVGMILCSIRHRQIMWYATFAASIWLLLAPVFLFRGPQTESTSPNAQT